MNISCRLVYPIILTLPIVPRMYAITLLIFVKLSSLLSAPLVHRYLMAVSRSERALFIIHDNLVTMEWKTSCFFIHSYAYSKSDFLRQWRAGMLTSSLTLLPSLNSKIIITFNNRSSLLTHKSMFRFSGYCKYTKVRFH